MSAFADALASHQPDVEDPSSRHWLYVPYDQLSDRLGPLATRDPDDLGIILIENPWKGRRRPYHKRKLALVLTNMRHFAVEQAQRGVAVRYEVGDGPYHQILASVLDDLGTTAQVMRPAEYELRVDLEPLVEQGRLKVIPHEGWLTDRDTFTKSQGKKKTWRMDSFYKKVRKKHDILMEDGSPVGGKYSHDKANRESWSGDPEAPEPPSFEPDEITREVIEVIEATFPHHIGHLEDVRWMPATRADAETCLEWAMHKCMVHFGPYEDAMSVASPVIFHTLLSPLVNMHRLTPREVLDEVLSLGDEVPINSREGFVRQLIGWREFMFHVHDTTDGLRALPGERADPTCASGAGDAHWGAYTEGAYAKPDEDEELVGGAEPSALGATNKLPAAFWGEQSGMFCLDHVVDKVMETGYSHHIERLMILSNIATLLDISPRELTDWFWASYMDAYDWVVEPNVLGMGTFGVGDLFTTKPYVSGSNYINKMSDYCSECDFDPRKDCPIGRLYWAFVNRHADTLGDNRRMGLIYGNLKRRSDEDITLDQDTYAHVIAKLANGAKLTPEDLPEHAHD